MSIQSKFKPTSNTKLQIFVGDVFQNGNDSTHNFLHCDNPVIFVFIIVYYMSHCLFIDLSSNFKFNDNDTEFKWGKKKYFQISVLLFLGIWENNSILCCSKSKCQSWFLHRFVWNVFVYDMNTMAGKVSVDFLFEVCGGLVCL